MTPTDNPFVLPASWNHLFLAVQNRLKNGTFGGILDPQFDAVFNKMGSLTQSLYARARIGIVYRSEIPPKYPQIGPPRIPQFPQYPCVSVSVYVAVLLWIAYPSDVLSDVHPDVHDQTC